MYQFIKKIRIKILRGQHKLHSSYHKRQITEKKVFKIKFSHLEQHLQLQHLITKQVSGYLFDVHGVISRHMGSVITALVFLHKTPLSQSVKT